MNTQSHAILSYALIRYVVGKRADNIRYFNLLIFTGSLLPDLPLYIFFTYFTFIAPVPQEILWGELYFQPFWQSLVSAFHSFPIWLTVVTVFLLLKNSGGALFGIAGFLSSAQDFLLHHDDAHAHFWPFSDYRFASPVSYWDPNYYGQTVAVVEIIAVLLVSIWVFRKLRSVWGRLFLVVAALSLLFTGLLWHHLFQNW